MSTARAYQVQGEWVDNPSRSEEVYMEALAKRAAIMDLLALIVIVIGVTVAVAGMYIVFGIGVALITAGVALTAFGVALGYR